MGRSPSAGSCRPTSSSHSSCRRTSHRQSIDREQLESALENLISNAINAMPDGGQITLSTYLAQGLLLQDVEEPRDYVVLEVQDTGVGMRVGVRRHVFEPGFSRTDQGTGLGLALVEKIVSDHRGRITVESEEGVGTSFSLYFPIED